MTQTGTVSEREKPIVRQRRQRRHFSIFTKSLPSFASATWTDGGINRRKLYTVLSRKKGELFDGAEELNNE